MTTARIRSLQRRLVASACALLTASLATAAGAACGDGDVEVGETCDDGNTSAGDGCDGSCAVESGASCSTQPRLAILNPSFESPLTSADWDVVTGSVDRVDGQSFAGCIPAGAGQFSIDMNGSTRGELAQTLTTVAGERYTVTLLGSANCVEQSGQSCSRTCSKRLTISAYEGATVGAPLALTTYDLEGSPQAGGWKRIRFEFQATGPSTRLLLSGSDPSAAGPMVDDFVVAESVCASDLCGNGSVEIGEVCDDGGTSGGDGCSSDCKVREEGYDCPVIGGAC
ncbi:MAG: DUF642 domain-containing protein, partial [Deltaproteobacteria bacterium]|nr:DUF642 domain-containing protein [Deltaproteobacteria bacterium]